VLFAYGVLTLYDATFQNASAKHGFCNSVKGLAPPLAGPTTPTWQRRKALPPDRFGLFPFRSPLLRESLLLSSPRGTEMFQFPRFPLPVLCVQTGVTPHDRCRVSPFGHPRIEAWSAAPRGLSQPPTSFFGFRRQGIHRWLFVAWRTKMLVLALKFSRAYRQTRGRSPRRAPALSRRRRSMLPQNGTEEPGASTLAGREAEACDRSVRLGHQASGQLRVVSSAMEELGTP
jgi:hypothetical protein